MSRRDLSCTVEAHPREEDNAEVDELSSCSGSGRNGTTRFMGMLIRRRCDSCGIRIDVKCQGEGRIVLSCPECHREYIFLENPE